MKSYLVHADLSREDVKLLQSLEEEPRDYKRGDTIMAQGEKQRQLYIVSKGWCFNYVHDADGRRQILDIHMPGEIAGMREVAHNNSISALEAATDCTLCHFPRSRLNDLFGASAKLTGIFFLISMRREAILMERVINLGRRDAFQRICHYISETQCRLSMINEEQITRIRQPLTQNQLSDAMGLSEVHINRVFKRLKESGWVTFDGQFIDLHNIGELQLAAQFSDEHLQIDKSWIAQK